MAIHSDAPQFLLTEVLKGFVSPRDLYLHLSWKNLYFSRVGLASGFSTPRLLLMPENSLSRAPAGQFNPTHFPKQHKRKQHDLWAKIQYFRSFPLFNLAHSLARQKYNPVRHKQHSREQSDQFCSSKQSCSWGMPLRGWRGRLGKEAGERCIIGVPWKAAVGSSYQPRPNPAHMVLWVMCLSNKFTVQVPP